MLKPHAAKGSHQGGRGRLAHTKSRASNFGPGRRFARLGGLSLHRATLLCTRPPGRDTRKGSEHGIRSVRRPRGLGSMAGGAGPRDRPDDGWCAQRTGAGVDLGRREQPCVGQQRPSATATGLFASVPVNMLASCTGSKLSVWSAAAAAALARAQVNPRTRARSRALRMLIAPGRRSFQPNMATMRVHDQYAAMLPIEYSTAVRA